MELDEKVTLVEDITIHMRFTPPSDDVMEEADEATMERPAKRQRRFLPKEEKVVQNFNFTRPPAVTDDLNDDLIDFGFSTTKVKAMVSQPQPMWDPWKKQSEELNRQTAILTERKRQAQRKRRVLEKTHVPLVLKKGSAWMLFDPDVHSYPTSVGAQAPLIFRTLERFEPGNKRIVEIHNETRSVRVRCTPKELARKRIVYSKTGPKITDDLTMEEVAEEVITVGAPPSAPPPPPVKRKPGRPRKNPEIESTKGPGNNKKKTRLESPVTALCRSGRMVIRKRRQEEQDESEPSDKTEL